MAHCWTPCTQWSPDAPQVWCKPSKQEGACVRALILSHAGKQTEGRCEQADGWGSGALVRSATKLENTVSGIKWGYAKPGGSQMVVLMRDNAPRSCTPYFSILFSRVAVGCGAPTISDAVWAAAMQRSTSNAGS